MAQAQLIVTISGKSSRIDLDDQSLTVGRHPSNTLCVADDRLSRHHCMIEPDGGGFKVTDMNSRNGVKLNGDRIAAADLRDGDTILIGRTMMQFIWPSQPASPPQRRVKPHESTRIASPAIAVASDDDDLDIFEPLPDDEPLVSAPASSAEEPPLTHVEAVQSMRQTVTNLPDAGFDPDQVNLLTSRRAPVQAAGEQSEGGGPLLQLLLTAGMQTCATDIHIEPRTEYHAVRMRVDGVMVDMVRLTPEAASKLHGVVKVLCEVDISRKQVVQEGHFTAVTPMRQVDYRVSFTPALNGQKLVIRVLDTSNSPQHTNELGLPKNLRDEIRAVTQRDAGMVMACGPTGSGKTTTLYAIIRDLDVGRRNVITIEDPVEYQVEGITQMPVNEHLGNTFPALLRSVLRQDPDVILLGEIRDAETARIAVQAAVTGHLVLTTVHSRDGIGTIFRLIDLGVEPHMVASAMNLILSQRLVRELCPACKIAAPPTPAERKRLGKVAESIETVHRPKGCARCLGTGYLGRRAVFELLSATSEIRDVLLSNPTMGAMREALNKLGTPTLFDSGAELVAKGITSMHELDRVAGGE